MAQGRALQGFRVLAVDLDPKGSLSETFGNFPSGIPVHNASISVVLRYDDSRVSIRCVIKPTHFDGLDLVAGCFELGEFERETSGRYHSENFWYPDASARMVSVLKDVEGDYDVVITVPYSFLTAGA
nr:AAA family ATPase [Sinorhizobium medicae]